MNFVIILQFICTNPQVLIRKAWLLIVFDEEIIEENKFLFTVGCHLQSFSPSCHFILDGQRARAIMNSPRRNNYYSVVMSEQRDDVAELIKVESIKSGIWFKEQDNKIVSKVTNH